MKGLRFTFRSRRVKSVGLMLIVCLALFLFLTFQSQHLQNASYSSGYCLMAAVLFLAAFNVRKKLAFLPSLGTAAFWMQLHIYVGLGTFLIFGCHIGWRIPNGGLEVLLAALYSAVALSGVYGLYMTRAMPSRLTQVGEEVIFERIPLIRKRLANQARELVLACTQNTEVIGNFYSSRLAPFFERSRGMAYLLCPSGRQRRQLVSEIHGLDRYLAQEQRHISSTLASYVKKKDDLDYHYAIQGRLKIWLFAHIGLTYSLVIVGILHGVLALAFRGNL